MKDAEIVSFIRHFFLLPSYRLYCWKPVLGTKLLGIGIGRGLGALKGLSPQRNFAGKKSGIFTALS